MVKPLLSLAALPLVYVASAAYWVVVASLVESRLAPVRAEAHRR